MVWRPKLRDRDHAAAGSEQVQLQQHDRKGQPHSRGTGRQHKDVAGQQAGRSRNRQPRSAAGVHRLAQHADPEPGHHPARSEAGTSQPNPPSEPGRTDARYAEQEQGKQYVTRITFELADGTVQGARNISEWAKQYKVS